MMTYYMHKDSQQQWRWYLKATNGKTIAVSSEAYHNKADCLASIALVKSSSNASVYELS